MRQLECDEKGFTGVDFLGVLTESFGADGRGGGLDVMEMWMRWKKVENWEIPIFLPYFPYVCLKNPYIPENPQQRTGFYFSH